MPDQKKPLAEDQVRVFREIVCAIVDIQQVCEEAEDFERFDQLIEQLTESGVTSDELNSFSQIIGSAYDIVSRKNPPLFHPLRLWLR